MNQTLLLAFIATLIGTAQPAHAQERTPYHLAQGEMMSMTASLNERYTNCINNPNCLLPSRLQIMVDLNEEMGKTLRQMNRTCQDMSYTNCMETQAAERRDWRQKHIQMSRMMASMDPTFLESKRQRQMDKKASTMSTKEPAAGNIRHDQYHDKSWWRDLWENREEPETKNE